MGIIGLFIWRIGIYRDELALNQVSYEINVLLQQENAQRRWLPCNRFLQQ